MLFSIQQHLFIGLICYPCKKEFFLPGLGVKNVIMNFERSFNSGAFVIDYKSRRFSLDGKFIFLRNKEFSLLVYFIENMGRVVSRTQILEEVWDRNVFCPTNTVDVHVSNLRQKFKKYVDRNYIKTVHCVGYIFEPIDK